MKLQEVKIMDVDSVGESSDDISLTVDTSQSVKLFNILIESYKNSRSSMIREYVSNAWDAHKEIGKTTTPVIVRISEDDGGNYIEIIDEGVGMTREFFNSIYSKLLATTKDSNNDQIGGFGIGSKTALAYTNYYYVTTTKDGETNEYAIYRESTKGVKISLLQTLPADEGVSGTRVKIYLLDKLNEERVIKDIAIKELLYFDNVVIEYAFSLNDTDVSNYNRNAIVESDLFKFKTNPYWYESLIYDKYIHLVIGNVAYPIDYKALKLDSEDYKIPVAIKFNIGELKVHMNRETIIYDDDTISLITDKLQQVKKYFGNKYLESRKKSTYTKLYSYIKDLKVFYTDTFVSITITEGVTLPVHKKSLITDEEDVTPTFKLFKILKLEGLEKTVKEIVYRNKYNEAHEIYKLVVEKIIDNSTIYFKTEISQGKIAKRVYSRNITKWTDSKLVIINSESELTNLSKDKYALKYFNNAYVIYDGYTKAKNKRAVIKNSSFLNGERFKKRVVTVHYDADRHVDYAAHSHNREIHHYSLGDITAMHAMYLFVKRELLANCKIIRYDKNFKVPKEVIDEYKRLEREARSQVYRAVGTIPTRMIYGNSSSPENPNATIKDFNLSVLNTFKGILVYGTKLDREYLGKAAVLLEDRFSKVEYRKKEHVFKVIQVAENNQQPFTKFKNAVNVRLLFMSNNKLIVQLYTSYLIDEKYAHILQNNMGAISKINSSIYKDLTTIKEYANTYYRTSIFISSIMKELDYIRKFSNLIDTRVKAELDRIEQYFEGVEFITTSTIIPGTEENVVKILKKFNKKVNWEWYHKPDKPHIETLVELQHTTRFMAYEPTDLINYDKSLKPIEVNKYCLTIK